MKQGICGLLQQRRLWVAQVVLVAQGSQESSESPELSPPAPSPVEREIPSPPAVQTTPAAGLVESAHITCPHFNLVPCLARPLGQAWGPPAVATGNESVEIEASPRKLRLCYPLERVAAAWA